MGKAQTHNLKGKCLRQAMSQRDSDHKKDIEILAAVIEMHINEKLAELIEQLRRAGEPMPDNVVISFANDEMQEVYSLSIKLSEYIKLI